MSWRLSTALRSSLFGCGDDDLFTFHVEHGGRWDLPVALARTSPAGPSRSREAMTYLAALHRERSWLAPSELLERIVEDRHVLELGAPPAASATSPGASGSWSTRRAPTGSATAGTLRDYLAWARAKAPKGARVVETVLPETDDDAVRIMTCTARRGSSSRS